MKKKLRRYLVAMGVGVLALVAVPAAGFGQADDYRNLEPGKRAELNEKVPVNFVFVGYERNDVNADRFRAGLPERYKPIVRSRYLCNKSIGKSLLGLNYTYDYDVKFAGGDYEKKVFRYLSGAAKPAISKHDYAATFKNARAAYEHALQGARDAGVPVEASNSGRTARLQKGAVSSAIPGRYIDRPQPAEQDEPLQRQKAEVTKVNEPQDFSPLAHRLRQSPGSTVYGAAEGAI